jgi:geranylgeranyl pyrophosphate synthase
MKNDLKKIFKPLDLYLSRVDEYIYSCFDTGIEVIDKSALHLFEGGGKKIRASLVLLCSGLKNSIPEGIIELSAATEIVHAASLIHDDIIDKSRLRRGNISVPEKWGNKVSVLVGDYMYTIALNIATEDGDPRMFPLMVYGSRDMVKGELYQLQYSNIENINFEHYIKIIELKTARFMAFSCKLGAVKSGYDEEYCDRLFNFGLHLGFAFQITDDILDITNDSKQTGKDIGNDLKDGKITLPFLYLIEKHGQEFRKVIKDYIEKPDTGKYDQIRDMLISEGAIDDSVKLARYHVDKSLDQIQEFPESEFKNILIDISNFLIKREF